jgi:peptide/nickel transport system substrate-binding protein
VWQAKYDAEGQQGVLDWANEEPLGSGPFKLEYWRKDEELKLAAFKEHFNAPAVDGILKIPYADMQGMVMGMKAGECDATGWSLEPLQFEELKALDHLSVFDVRMHGFYHINYNMRREPFDDVAVRQALTYAIPKQQIIDELLEGHADVAHAFIAPVNEFWHNPDPALEEYTFDMDKARQVLEEAGYEWDEDGALYYPAQGK